MPLTDWIVEPTNGGLVTSRDPLSLQPGECPSITNGIYLPNTDALVRAPGREEWCAAVTGVGTKSVFGLLDCPFSGGTHYLIAATTDGYKTIDVEAGSPTASLLEALTLGLDPQAVFASNRYFLLDGSNDNRVFLKSGTTRLAGLEPVVLSPNVTVTTTTAANAWQAGTGYFKYWYTEVVRSYATAEGSDGTTPTVYESGFVGTPSTVHVTATNAGVEVAVPRANLVNARTTHLRVYRAGPLADPTDAGFPDGVQVLEVATGAVVNAAIDGAYPTTASSSAGTVDTAVGWTSPSNVFGAGSASLGLVKGTTHTFVAKNYGFSVGDPIAGIVCTVKQILHSLGSNNADSINVWVEISPDAGTSWYQVGGTASLTSTSNVDIVFGSSSTLPNGYAWQAGSFTNANFRIRVKTRAISEVAGALNDSILWDGPLEVAISYNATNADGTNPYPTIAPNGILQPKHGPMSKASCGAVYEDCLVTDDVENPGRIRWSFPGEPETFPPLYFLDLPVRRNESITTIRVVNNRLIVTTNSSTYRVNYLPNENDDTFVKGRMLDLLSDVVGAIRPSASCILPSLDGRNELAFVSTTGVFSTDSVVLRSLSSDLDWYASTAGQSGFSSMADTIIGIINDPDYNALFLPTLLGEVYVASYAERHRKPGAGVKWSRFTGTNSTAGPTVTGSVKSMCSVLFADGIRRVLIGYTGSGLADGGKIFIQDDVAYSQGLLLPALFDKLGWTTRRIFPAGFGREAALLNMALYKADTVAYGVSATLTTYMTNHTTASESVTMQNLGVNVLQCPVNKTNGIGFQVAFIAASNGVLKPLFTAYEPQSYSDGVLHQ